MATENDATSSSIAKCEIELTMRSQMMKKAPKEASKSHG